MITSLKNPVLKSLLSLQDKKERKSRSEFGVEGLPEIQKAIAHGFELSCLAVCPPLLIKESESLLNAAKSIPKHGMSEDCFDRLLVRKGKSGGVYAVFKEKKQNLSDLQLPEHALIVVLDEVEKPGNIGAVLRTADGAGVHAVFTTGVSTDFYNPNLIRSSLGCVFSIPVFHLEREEAYDFFVRKKIATVGAVLSEKSKIYDQGDLARRPLAILMGNEDKGLSPYWISKCDRMVQIPMHGSADSLNVSVAAAVLMYEADRQFRVLS